MIRRNKLKKYIIAIMFGLLLPTVSYAKCCDCCQKDKEITGIMTITDTGIKKLIGKMVHRTKPFNACGGIADRSFINEHRKLLMVTDEYLILSSDILESGQYEIDRATWDDGNWEEAKPKLLTVAEAIRSEKLDTMSYWASGYYCPKCGKSLKWNLAGHYCASCKTGFDIKEE